jgi:hypothetical protein
MELSPASENQIDEAFAPHIGKSILKKLILDQQNIDAFFLEVLLQLPSALEQFIYTPKDAEWHGTLLDVVDALLVQRKTLRTVNLRIVPGNLTAFDWVFFDEGFWTKFPVLQHLAVPLQPLITSPGQAPVRMVRDDDCLNRAFPKGIKSLRFYLFEEWHAYYQRCWTWRRIVNSICKKAYPELDTIWVGAWDSQCLVCGIFDWPIWKPGWKKENVKVDVKHFVWKPNRPWRFTVWRGDTAIMENLAIFFILFVLWVILYQLGLFSLIGWLIRRFW